MPCAACAHGEFDFCRNGRYTERGIKELHGYGSERWTVEADYAVKLDPALEPVGMLMEPTTIVAKAWEQIERIGSRAYFEPERVLVTGAGPIGLLAALLGVQRGLEVHVLDRDTDGPKPELVRRARRPLPPHRRRPRSPRPRRRTSSSRRPAPSRSSLDAMEHNAAFGIVCLTGVSPRGRSLRPSTSAASTATSCSRTTSCSARSTPTCATTRWPPRRSRRADRAWLERLITRRVPLEDFEEAFEKRPTTSRSSSTSDTIAAWRRGRER